MLTTSKTGELEQLVDGATLQDVVEALATICREKAEHIRVNWQDRQTARPWDGAAAKLERIAAQLDV